MALDTQGLFMAYPIPDLIGPEVEARLRGRGDGATDGDGFSPPADVEETDDAYLVDIELPGVRKEDVRVEIANGRLVVTGERAEKERTGLLHRRGRSAGRFRFVITLPQSVDEDQVRATLNDGVLSVRVPKTTATSRRRIEVT